MNYHYLGIYAIRGRESDLNTSPSFSFINSRCALGYLYSQTTFLPLSLVACTVLQYTNFRNEIDISYKYTV